MHPLNLGVWIWLLPVIGVMLAIIIYWWLRQTKLLDDIKADLTRMNVIERNTATKVSLQLKLSAEKIEQVFDDYLKVMGTFVSNITGIGLKKGYDTLDTGAILIEYNHLIGNILDTNNLGLKMALIDDDEYKTSKLDVEQKRLQLKPKRKHRFIYPNIDRIMKESYGLNSCIILRGVFKNVPEYTKEIPIEIRHILEENEKYSQVTVNNLISNIEKDWGKRKGK